MARKKAQTGKLVVDAATYIGSCYSQLVSVTVTDFDITLEFVYIDPRDKAKGEVVSRVTLPSQAGENLAEVIKNTVAAHKKKEK